MPHKTAGSYSNPINQQIYRDLPSGFFEESIPAASPAPELIALNEALLSSLNMSPEWFRSDAGLATLSGNGDYVQPPIAMAYAAHQFGHWVPLLGDGRAHMLGQITDTSVGTIDVQLKGSGRTRYSRNGDGLATLGSVLREYIVSEAMAGLGIPSTRALAVIGTGQNVMREAVFPGALLVRTAQSHLRVGSFQLASAAMDEKGLAALADFTIARYFPELAAREDKYLELLNVVIERQARLVAKWMLVGFIHGVMNTDNMSIVGETIDYGPCAFMDEFHPQKVFSSIDRNGRYAWDQQPNIALWNLAQFAGALMPLIHADATEAETLVKSRLDNFAPVFRATFDAGMRSKLGIGDEVSSEEMSKLSETTLGAMAESQIDFTLFFDLLTRTAVGESNSDLLQLFKGPEKGNAWWGQWQSLSSENPDVITAMRKANPAVIARNHRVEEAIEAAVKHADYRPFHRLCKVLASPYEIAASDDELQLPPNHNERVMQTFCGT